MEIEFSSKDQIWQDEKTIYWFEVDGEMFGLVDHNGELSLVDFEGYPIEECNDHENVREALIGEYHKHIND